MIQRLLFLALICASFIGKSQTTQPDSLSKKEIKAQKKQDFVNRNEVFRMTALSLYQTQIQDLRMSPLIYSGLGIHLDLARLRYGTKSLSKWNFQLGYAGSRSQSGSWSLMHVPNFKFGYTLQKKLKFPVGQIYLGADLENQLVGRIYLPLGNNGFGGDNQLTLSPAVTFVQEGVFDSRWSIWLFSKLGLIGGAVRYPEFGYGDVETRFNWIGPFQKWEIELAGTQKFKYDPNNQFYIAYHFELYRFSSRIDQAPVSQYINSIKIAFWLHRK